VLENVLIRIFNQYCEYISAHLEHINLERIIWQAQKVRDVRFLSVTYNTTSIPYVSFYSSLLVIKSTSSFSVYWQSEKHRCLFSASARNAHLRIMLSRNKQRYYVKIAISNYAKKLDLTQFFTRSVRYRLLRSKRYFYRILTDFGKWIFSLLVTEMKVASMKFLSVPHFELWRSINYKSSLMDDT